MGGVRKRSHGSWEGCFMRGTVQAAGRRLSFFEKIQGLEVGKRNEACSSIYSSSTTHNLQKIVFLLHSLMAKHTDESSLVVLKESV